MSSREPNPSTASAETTSLATLLQEMSENNLEILMESLNKGVFPLGLYDGDANNPQAEKFNKFLENHSIKVLSLGNNKNFKIIDNNTGKSQVLTLSPPMGSGLALDETTSNSLQDEGVLSKKYVDRGHDMGAKGKFTLSLTDFFSKGSLEQTYENKGLANKELHTLCNQSMQKMATAFEKLQDEMVLFPDAKVTNWMLDDNGELIIADTKSLIQLNDRGQVQGASQYYNLLKTPGYIPPEIEAILPPDQVIDADKVHAYVLAANIYDNLTCWEPPANLQDAAAFENDVFSDIVGQQYADLIQGLTKKNPQERMGVAQAKQELKFIEFLRMAQQNNTMDLNKIIESKEELKSKYQDRLDNPDNFEEIAKSIMPLKDKIHYNHAVENDAPGRKHAFTVKGASFADIKETYMELKGDQLKTKILKDVKSELENIGSKEDLDKFKNDFKKSDEYKVLKTGQGLATKLFGFKTSSVKAFEDLIAESESSVDSNNRPQF